MATKEPIGEVEQPPDGALYRRTPLLLFELRGSHLVLTHCDTMRRFRVDNRLIELLSKLEEWTTLGELSVNGNQVSENQVLPLVEMGIIEKTQSHRQEASEGATEADHVQKNYWNPFDLVVQRSHNWGGYREDVVRARPVGPPPAFKPLPEGPTTDLPPATPLDVPIGDVLATRRSVRTYSDRPLRLEELSSVLHHSARICGTFTDSLLGEHAFRPYPAGGGRSELEIHVVSNSVEGLNQGAHYFDARGHRLIQVTKKDAEQDRINEWVFAATGGSLNHPPQAILLITAVFARIMWKYQGIGLATIMRNTGSLYQTLYLTATALGLAPCGIGGGPEMPNARWLGLDPLIESQVGAVLLGTRE